MSTGRQLTLFDCVSSGTSPKRLKIQMSYGTDSNACLESTDSYELQELRESESDCSNTVKIYSGDLRCIKASLNDFMYLGEDYGVYYCLLKLVM